MERSSAPSASAAARAIRTMLSPKLVRRLTSYNLTGSIGFLRRGIASCFLPTSPGSLQQLAQFVQVLRAGVADHEIAKTVVAPASDPKRVGRQRRISADISQVLLLKDENRDLVLAHSKNEFRARRLVEIADFPAYQHKR